MVVGLAALVTYLPAVVVPYAFLDDYSNLASEKGFGGSVWEVSVQGGRPIGGLLLDAAYSATPHIDALRVMRVVALLGAVLLGLLLYYALRRTGANRVFSTGVAVSVVEPALMQVYAPGQSSSKRRSRRSWPGSPPSAPRRPSGCRRAGRGCAARGRRAFCSPPC